MESGNETTPLVIHMESGNEATPLGDTHGVWE